VQNRENDKINNDAIDIFSINDGIENILFKEYKKNKLRLLIDCIVFFMWLLIGGKHVIKNDFGMLDYCSMWIVFILFMARNVLDSKIEVSRTKIEWLDFKNKNRLRK